MEDQRQDNEALSRCIGPLPCRVGRDARFLAARVRAIGGRSELWQWEAQLRDVPAAGARELRDETLTSTFTKGRP
jgi:hypothetical protein